MKKRIFALLTLALMLLMTGCNSGTNTTSNNSTTNTTESAPVTIKTSPDKYTWYIKNYVGKNCATVGYTSLSVDRMDTYGEGYIELILLTEDGSCIDLESDEELKEYVVTGQNIEPNTELKYTFQKDEDGEEYDNLIDFQNISEIVLSVKKVGDSTAATPALTAITPSPDKYTHYISDFVGRNLADCGYVALSGEFMQAYGDGYVKLVIITEDGSFIDPEDTDLLKKYIVTGQNIAPNSELKYTYYKDSDGSEYDSLVESQNIEEIELSVKELSVE